ncbi:MAG: DUF1566 domain-containing protein [Bacteroidales bacterium]
MLNDGYTPLEIYNSGIPLSSIYGKFYQGGLITYLNTTTGNGLIAASIDQAATTNWGCSTVLMGASGTAIGTGAQNTILIEAGCTTAGIATDVCANLNLNGYSDWFLPSKDELFELYQNLYIYGIGGIRDNVYWSSSESNASSAWAWSMKFGEGSGLTPKNSGFGTEPISVRAVRAF